MEELKIINLKQDLFGKIKKFIVSELKAGDVLVTLGAGEANLCGVELLKHLRDKN